MEYRLLLIDSKHVFILFPRMFICLEILEEEEIEKYLSEKRPYEW